MSKWAIFLNIIFLHKNFVLANIFLTENILFLKAIFKKKLKNFRM